MLTLLTLYWYVLAAVVALMALAAFIALFAPDAWGKKHTSVDSPQSLIVRLVLALPAWVLAFYGYGALNLPAWLFWTVLVLTLLGNIASLVRPRKTIEGGVPTFPSGLLLTLYIAWVGLQALRGGLA